MVVTLQCSCLDRHLWNAPGNSGYAYPQIDAGPAPPEPSAQVNINSIYPHITGTISGHLQIQATGIMPMMENNEPVPPVPAEPIYVQVPFSPISDLPGIKLRVTWDGYTIAGRLYRVSEQSQPPEPPHGDFRQKIWPKTYPVKYPFLYPPKRY